MDDTYHKEIYKIMDVPQFHRPGTVTKPKQIYRGYCLLLFNNKKFEELLLV